MIEIVGWAIAAVLVGATIGIHYEIMRIVSDSILPWAINRFHDRRVMIIMIAALMVDTSLRYGSLRFRSLCFLICRI